MFKGLMASRVIVAGIAAAAIYVALRYTLGLDNFIVILNGAFIGAGITYIVAFSDILRDAVFGHGPYDRVRQMALGMLIVWAAVAVAIVGSIWGRATGIVIQSSELTPIARYLSILGGMVQITAPDYGLGVLYGRDRKLLLLSFAAGIVVAIALIMAQT